MIIQMNILYLKYVVEIAKTGSINKAAENLFIAQPNMSRAVKELEASLGVTLFDRTSKGMTPTPEGEKLLQYATNILRQVDEVEALFDESRNDRQTFSISVPRASYIAKAFANFSRSIEPEKRTEIFYNETNSMRAVNNILQGDYKLGIIRYAAQYDHYFREMLEEKGLQYETVTEFSYILLMGKENPLSERAVIKYKDLHPYIEIAHADPFVPSLPLAEVRKSELPNDVMRRIFVFERASQFELLTVNPETFMWVSPIPNDLLERYQLVQKKCEDNNRVYKDVLIYKNNYHLSKLDNAFITELCNSKRKYL